MQSSVNAGGTYKIPAFIWIQGEHDCRTNEEGAAIYFGKLDSLIEELVAFVGSLKIQKNSPRVVLYQLSTYESFNNNNKRMVLPTGLIGFVNARRNNMTIGAATYQLPYQNDRLHPTNNGFRLLGAMLGNAEFEFAYKGNKNTFINPVSVNVQNYSSKYIIEIKFDVPCKPLVFDDKSPLDGTDLKFYDIDLNEVVVSNYGFELMNSDWYYDGVETKGSVTAPKVANWNVQNIITSVSIKRGDTVVVECSSNPSGMELWYARSGNQGGGYLRD